MNRRVVVTGMGALTPIGHSVPEFTENLMMGIHGIAPITHYDTTDSKFKLAAEIKNFDPLKRIDKAVLRKTDLFVQYALYAGEEAMEDSKLVGAIAPDRLAVYFGSVKITNTRYAVIAGLAADFIGITAAILLGYLFFH